MGSSFIKEDLYSRFLASGSARRLFRMLESGNLPRSVAGLPGALRAFLLAALKQTGQGVLFLAKNIGEIEQIQGDLEGLGIRGITPLMKPEDFNLLRMHSSSPRLILSTIELAAQPVGWTEGNPSLYMEVSGKNELT
ncbi:hypothetical protein GF359_00195, partial [candidate division WOR-3 bacterium]|nr:hypothetical protein [candidate division WOR-3 bacterium]MBD3363613.1 hypothetical protein [candidate division WOR-3 bacterium]